MNNPPWVLKKIVLPQHTDHAAVMWHGAYANWLEEARIDALREVGLSYSNISSLGYELPVVELKIRFLKPLFHGDQVDIKSYLVKDRNFRLIWKSEFFQKGVHLTTKAQVDLVLINSKKKLVKFSELEREDFLKAFSKLLNGPSL